MHDDTRLRLRLASGGETRILVGSAGKDYGARLVSDAALLSPFSGEARRI